MGSDCSGYGTEIVAAELLGIGHRVEHVFASENDSKVREILRWNHPHLRMIYDDVSHVYGDDTPRVDLYGNTSPCQSFSCAGRQDLRLRQTAPGRGTQGRNTTRIPKRPVGTAGNAMSQQRRGSLTTRVPGGRCRCWRARAAHGHWRGVHQQAQAFGLLL